LATTLAQRKTRSIDWAHAEAS